MSGDDPLSTSSSSATILGEMADLQTPSQAQGFTVELFGLEMPTETAKKLGSSIGLPDHHIHRRIRPSTPQRTTFRRSPYLSTTAMGPPKKQEKRKASPTVHQGRRISPLKTSLNDKISTEAVVESDPESQKYGASVYNWLKGVYDDQESHTSKKDMISSTLEKLQIRYHISIDKAVFSRFTSDQASNLETGFKGTLWAFQNPSSLSSLESRASFFNTSRAACFHSFYSLDMQNMPGHGRIFAQQL